MKISTLFTLLIILGAVFTLVAMTITESNNIYPDSNIDEGNWSTQYQFTQEINQSIAPLQQAFADIQDPNNGWFNKIASGILSVPIAIVTIPAILFNAFTMVGSLIVGLLSAIGVPPEILYIPLVMVVVWGIFKLIELYQRWQI